MAEPIKKTLHRRSILINGNSFVSAILSATTTNFNIYQN